ncbi:MAG TPA: amino acid permease, partial [Cyclobacteriaceae bacterium]|nr:amino acid permease [Cyclobacteriaceae bacterium]
DMLQSGLKRVLGKWSLTALGVGSVIGAGIFVMTGLAAKEFAGPALALSFVIAGLGCAFAGLCYAEFASIIPVEGSAYAYSFATVGELFAWIIGWDLILEYSMASSTVAVGWSGYFLKLMGLFHIHLPLWLANDLYSAKNLLANAMADGTMADLSASYSSIDIPTIFGLPVAVNLPAVIICLTITWILLRGIKEAANTNLLMVVLKVTVVLFVIVVGAYFIDPRNWDPFIPAPALNSQGIMAFGYGGIMAGAAYVFFAYIGFDTVSTQAGEARNPRKDVPFGLLVSLLICTVLYISVSLVITGMVKYTDLDIKAPIAAAFSDYGLNFAVWLISIAAVAGLTSVLLVQMLGQSRLFLAMAKDGLLPKKIFAEIHPRTKVPYRGTALIGIAVAITAGLIPIETIAKLVNIGTLFAFIMVCIAVMMMRSSQPNVNRPFKVPYVYIIAPLGVIFNLGMMLSLGWENWMRLFVWLILGLIVYFSYSQKHSVIRKAMEGKKI